MRNTIIVVAAVAILLLAFAGWRFFVSALAQTSPDDYFHPLS